MSTPSTWIPNAALIYNGQGIALSTFRGPFIHGVFDDLQRIMQDRRLFIPDLPNVRLDQNVDYDILSHRLDAGYSIVTDSRSSSVLGTVRLSS